MSKRRLSDDELIEIFEKSIKLSDILDLETEDLDIDEINRMDNITDDTNFDIINYEEAPSTEIEMLSEEINPSQPMEIERHRRLPPSFKRYEPGEIKKTEEYIEPRNILKYKKRPLIQYFEDVEDTDDKGDEGNEDNEDDEGDEGEEGDEGDEGDEDNEDNEDNEYDEGEEGDEEDEDNEDDEEEPINPLSEEYVISDDDSEMSFVRYKI